MDLELLTRLYEDHVRDLTRRYSSAMNAAGFDAVVIHSGSLRKRTEYDDQYWPLRVTPHFQHWAPLAQPDCALVIAAGKRPVLCWLQTVDFWERPAPPETLHFTGAFTVATPARVDDVKRLIDDAAGNAGARVAFIGEDVARAGTWGFDGTASRAINPAALAAALDQLRVTKTPYEVLCLAEANRRAAVGHAAVVAAFRDGDRSELDLHLDFLRATGQDDPETPYKNIVALGANAATLHHVSYVKHPRAAPVQSLLLDARASYQGYCSDITRTWVKGTGATAAAFGALVDGVEKMQQRLCGAVRLGQPYEELHDETHRQVATILRDVGLARAQLSGEELVASGVTRAFFPHGLGHSLGLQCHDVGCALIKPKKENPWLRNTAPVAEGQCFTIEPGVYFIDALLAPLRATGVGAAGGGIDWTLVDQLAALGGVRIEDDLVVTGGAAVTRNLTREVLP
jgi:Xaa-Pro dipeptidase